jgi:hypothetical protein
MVNNKKTMTNLIAAHSFGYNRLSISQAGLCTQLSAQLSAQQDACMSALLFKKSDVSPTLDSFEYSVEIIYSLPTLFLDTDSPKTRSYHDKRNLTQ